MKHSFAVQDCWARAFDCSDFGSALVATACFRMHRGQLRQVEQINLCSASQCHGGLLGLCSVAKIVHANIFTCGPGLLKHADSMFARRLVPALAAMPCLEQVWLHDAKYLQVHLNPEFYPRTQGENFVNALAHMLEAFAGALSAGMFRKLRWIDYGGYGCPKRHGYETCMCREIVGAFPPLNMFAHAGPDEFCVNTLEILQLAVKKGGDVNAGLPRAINMRGGKRLKAISCVANILNNLDYLDYGPSTSEGSLVFKYLLEQGASYEAALCYYGAHGDAVVTSFFLEVGALVKALFNDNGKCRSIGNAMQAFKEGDVGRVTELKRQEYKVMIMWERTGVELGESMYSFGQDFELLPMLTASDGLDIPRLAADLEDVDKPKEVDDPMEEALQKSNEEALEQENSNLAEALLLSKTDMPALSGDNVVLLRLSRRSKEVVNHLLESPLLQEIRTRVLDSGCELLPKWAHGAVLLVPLTAEQIIEARIELRAHHILALHNDMHCMTAAFATLPKRHRPKVKVDCGSVGPICEEVCATAASELECSASGIQVGLEGEDSHACVSASSASTHQELECELIIENTFLMFAIPPDASECSTFVQSAPGATNTISEPPNPRRWRLARDTDPKTD